MKITRQLIRKIIEETFKLDSAQVLSQMAHQGQQRRSGEPYFLHPQEVANIVRGYYQDTETYYVAMLHDALEDGIPLGNIEDEEDFFNMLAAELPASDIEAIDDIYNSVVSLTRYPGSDYQSYVVNLTQDKFAFRVKLADMMHNINDNPSEKQIKKYTKTKEMLVDMFGGNVPRGINAKHWRDFQRKIEEAGK